MAHAPSYSSLAKSSVRGQLVELMKQERHEEALELLYEARSADPTNPELIQSIDHLKGFLVGVYAARLGGLDRIAAGLPKGAARSAETLMLARYMNQSSSFGDLAAICPLGQIRTLQLLVQLFPDTASNKAKRAQASDSGTLGPEEQAASSLLRPKSGDEESAPQTARSPSSSRRGIGAPVFNDPQSDEARRYKDLFAKGTAAFVQERFQEAVDAFGACVELREKDPAAGVMLRRCLQGLNSQIT